MEKKYKEMRDMWHPGNSQKNPNQKVKILFVGESPPDSGGYFFDGKASVRSGTLSDYLFEALGYATRVKKSALELFQDDGHWLTDMIDAPRKSMASVDMNAEKARLAQELTDSDPRFIVTIFPKSRAQGLVEEFDEIARGLRMQNRVVHAPSPWDSPGKFKGKVRGVVSLL